MCQMQSLIVLAVFVNSVLSQTTASTTVSSDCSGATWLAWSDWSTCSDTCGSCGLHLRTRTCLTDDSSCTCSGNSTVVEYCNLTICRYPRTTCCYNLKVTSLNGIFACSGTSTSSTDSILGR